MSPPPLYSLYINDRQPHYLLCTSITPPEDELQQQIRKFVTKSPCPDEAFYFQIVNVCWKSFILWETVYIMSMNVAHIKYAYLFILVHYLKRNRFCEA